MHIRNSDPTINALALWSNHGVVARLIAAQEAYKALCQCDVEKCSYWRDVMDELEVIYAREQPRQ